MTMQSWTGSPYSAGAMNPMRGVSEWNIEDAYTPRQLFGQFASGYSPDIRRGLWGSQAPMEALWRLGGVGVPGATPGAPQYASNPFSESFADYIRNVPGGGTRTQMAGEPSSIPEGFYGGRDAMLARAREASRIAMMATPDFDAGWNALEGNKGQAEFGQTRERYGTGSEAYSNQLAAAQAIALMKQGGGMYGGEMRSGIESALQEIQAGRAARGFTPGSFLQWYTGTQ